MQIGMMINKNSQVVIGTPIQILEKKGRLPSWSGIQFSCQGWFHNHIPFYIPLNK
jgi:hypothetical protein